MGAQWDSPCNRLNYRHPELRPNEHAHTTEILPEQVQFECGGAASTEICYTATMSCLDSAESFAEMLYKVSPFEGSEMHPLRA